MLLLLTYEKFVMGLHYEVFDISKISMYYLLILTVLFLEPTILFQI